jgi:hypothetical protein
LPFDGLVVVDLAPLVKVVLLIGLPAGDELVLGVWAKAGKAINAAAATDAVIALMAFSPPEGNDRQALLRATMSRVRGGNVKWR